MTAQGTANPPSQANEGRKMGNYTFMMIFGVVMVSLFLAIPVSLIFTF
jgi:hypothetical protein